MPVWISTQNEKKQSSNYQKTYKRRTDSNKVKGQTMDGFTELLAFGQFATVVLDVGTSIYRFCYELEQESILRQKLEAYQNKELEDKKKEEEARKWKEEYPCPELLKEYLNDINIAVSGETGVGKSTMINMMLGRTPGQEGAAEEDVKECTVKATKYEMHVNNICVNVWDLPGAGTQKIPLLGYIQNQGIRWYDVVVIVSDSRLREIDVELVKECERTSVRYFFVRTKMDQSVDDNRLKGIPAKQTFHSVRQWLHYNGIKKPYLIGRNYVRFANSNDWLSRNFYYQYYYQQNEDYRNFLNDLFENAAESAKEIKKYDWVKNKVNGVDIQFYCC